MRFENISCGLNDGVQEKDGVLLGTVTYIYLHLILHQKITWSSLLFFRTSPSFSLTGVAVFFSRTFRPTDLENSETARSLW